MTIRRSGGPPSARERSVPLTRRKLLVGLGTGFGAATGAAALAPQAVALPNTTTLQQVDAGVDLRVDWRESYNGSVLEGADFPAEGSDAPAGPVIDIPNGMPGDVGRLTVRLSLLSTSAPARVFLSLDLLDEAENGRTEPERKAEDTTPTAGELPDAVRVAVWYDDGIFDELPVGERNAVRDPGESLVTSGAEGTLASVTDTAVLGYDPTAPDEEPVPVDPALDTTDHECFQPGETSVLISLGWGISPATGNVIQSDSVRFALRFYAEECVVQ